MSIESLPSRVAITDITTGLEDALARIVASLRSDLAREVSAAGSERRAAVAVLGSLEHQFRSLQCEFERWFEEIKKQRIEMRGERGERGQDGPPGPPGEAGAQGAAGRDGRDGLPGVPGPPGERGRDGTNGIDGKDGLSLTDLDVVHDGRRMLTLRLKNADRLIEKSITLPIPIYCGTWESGKAYEANDMVTYAGQMFEARCDTDKRPFSDDWQLCSKKGADGKDGKEGKAGPVGPAGRNGRDLTQLGADGRKW